MTIVGGIEITSRAFKGDGSGLLVDEREMEVVFDGLNGLGDFERDEEGGGGRGEGSSCQQRFNLHDARDQSSWMIDFETSE